MKLEDRPATEIPFDAAQDVTDSRRATPAEREVIDLLELDPVGRPYVRLTGQQWRMVDRVAARIEEAVRAVPAPRSER